MPGMTTAIATLLISTRARRTRIWWVMTSRLPRSEIHLEVDVEDVPVRADRHRICRVADGRLAHVNELAVQAEPTILHEVPIPAASHFPRVAIGPEDL